MRQRFTQTQLTAGVTFAALIGGLAIAITVGGFAMGWGSWWHTFIHRKLEASPYDLLFGTIAGANVVMLALYFTIVGALLSDRTWRGDDTPQFSSLWISFPCLLETLCVAVLGGRGWGFPPFSGALVALAIVGVLASWAYAQLAGHVIRLMEVSARA